MRRLSQTLAAAGAAMLVACSDNPPTAPLATAKAATPALDTQAVRMSRAANDYLKQLRAGVAGKNLDDGARRERIAHVQRFIQAADSAVNLSRSGIRSARFDDVPEPGGEEPPPPSFEIFVDGGTFTDLCLSCKNASGFAETILVGLVTSTTSASIQSAGHSYNPSSGVMMCPSPFCLSTIDLTPIVDCRVYAASGTATSTAAYLIRFLALNWTVASKTTYDQDECTPVPALSVSLGSSSISVGTTTQANTTCAGFLQWSSSSPRVATVSNTGVVTGVAAGTSEISATCGANRGSAIITVTLAQEETPSGQCDDLMTPMVETCDSQSSQDYPPFSVTYTRPGYYGEAEDSWFTSPEYVESYTVVCDVTDWYQWNADHTVSYYVGTDVNSCWLQPNEGNQH